jgi:hypothetical protein
VVGNSNLIRLFYFGRYLADIFIRTKINCFYPERITFANIQHLGFFNPKQSKAKFDENGTVLLGEPGEPINVMTSSERYGLVERYEQDKLVLRDYADPPFKRIIFWNTVNLL